MFVFKSSKGVVQIIRKLFLYTSSKTDTKSKLPFFFYLVYKTETLRT